MVRSAELTVLLDTGHDRPADKAQAELAKVMLHLVALPTLVHFAVSAVTSCTYTMLTHVICLLTGKKALTAALW